MNRTVCLDWCSSVCFVYTISWTSRTWWCWYFHINIPRGLVIYNRKYAITYGEENGDMHVIFILQSLRWWINSRYWPTMQASGKRSFHTLLLAYHVPCHRIDYRKFSCSLCATVSQKILMRDMASAPTLKSFQSPLSKCTKATPPPPPPPPPPPFSSLSALLTPQ